MKGIKSSLKRFLEGARSVGILGVGSELRADDAAGMMAAELLEIFESKGTSKTKFKVFLGATAPENLTGEIKRFDPSHLIIIDTADLGKRPGEALLLDREKISNFSFSTHKLPIKIMIEYLRQSISPQVAIIGIQPASLDFGKPVCAEVKASASGIAEGIMEILLEGGQ